MITTARRIQNKNIKHIRLMVIPGKFKGVGPFQAGRTRHGKRTQRLLDYSNSFLKTGGIPTGVLSSDQFLNQEQADAYRDRLGRGTRDTRTRCAWCWVVLLSHLPHTRRPPNVGKPKVFNTLKIARLFGIPTHLLGGRNRRKSSLTYATTETLGIFFLQTTMADYLVSIEEAFTDLLPRGQKGNLPS